VDDSVNTESSNADRDDRAALEAELALIAEENGHLRSRLADTPTRVRSLEERLLETKGS
jgi:proteasome-associated ATPase